MLRLETASSKRYHFPKERMAGQKYYRKSKLDQLANALVLGAVQKANNIPRLLGLRLTSPSTSVRRGGGVTLEQQMRTLRNRNQYLTPEDS